MYKINDKNYLSLLYLRRPLVEHMYPPEFVDDFKFLSEESRKEIFNPLYSRPEQVRNLLIHMSKNAKNSEVEIFIKTIVKKCETFLPSDCQDVLDNIEKLRSVTFRPEIQYCNLYKDLPPLPYKGHVDREELRKEIVKWITKIDGQEPSFVSNEPTCPSFLLLYGLPACGKTVICSELFKEDDMRANFPNENVIRVELEDLNEVGEYVYERIKDNVNRPNELATPVGQQQQVTENESLILVDDKSTLIDRVNILMTNPQRQPASRILLILDNVPNHFCKKDFEKYFSFKNFVILIISSDEKMLKEFPNEYKFEIKNVFTEIEWIKLFKRHLPNRKRILQTKEQKDKLLVIAKKLDYLPGNLMKLIRHFHGCYSLEDRIEYFAKSVLPEKIKEFLSYDD